MKLYGGIDLHSNNSVIAIKDDTGKVLVCKKLPNDWELIQRFLEPYKEMLIGLVIESTYNWYWLVDALIGAKFCVHLANTAAIQQYSGLKYADDNSDAQTHEPNTTINSKLVVYSGHIHASSKLQAQ